MKKAFAASRRRVTSPPPVGGGEGTINTTDTRYAAGGWNYADLVAIYNRPGDPSDMSAYANAHEDQVLHSSSTFTSSNRLFIPFALPQQWAAHPGHTGWRTFFTNGIVAAASTHMGVMVDDVNLGSVNTVTSSGASSPAWDQFTGAFMTAANWDRYHAEFCEYIFAQYPANKEVVHNMPVFAGPGGTGSSQRSWVIDSNFNRVILSCDFMMIERGICDAYSSNNNKFSWQNVWDYCDYLHSHGVRVTWFPNNTSLYPGGTAAGAEYQLAAYFLFNVGADPNGDLVLNQTGASYYNTINLGDALGLKYLWTGTVWRRDFTGGFVILNTPGATTQNVSLGGSYRNVSGTFVTTASLPAASGKVFRNS